MAAEKPRGWFSRIRDDVWASGRPARRPFDDRIDKTPTSLGGGDGSVFGTLVGAFIIAVIQNGMNLTGVESYTQKVVLGLVILGAVLFEQVRRLLAERRRVKSAST